MSAISTKPYLIRAIHEWCTDSGYRPYIAVTVDERTVVPREFVHGGEIVLNVSSAATNRLSLGNELIEFEARFGGVARMVSIPIENVSAIYAQETGQGMAFEVPRLPAATAEAEPADPKPATVPTLVETAATAAQAVDATPAGARKRPRLAAVPAVRPEDAPEQEGLAASPDAGAQAGGDAGSSPAEDETATTRPVRRRRKAPGGKSGDAAPGVSGSGAASSEAASPEAPSPEVASPAAASPIAATTAPKRQTTEVRETADDESPDPPPRGRPRLTRVK